MGIRKLTRYALTVPLPPVQADSDGRLIELWLHGRPATTTRAYRAEAGRFLDHVQRPLRQVTLADVQTYVDTLADRAPATRARSINAVRSLFAFGLRLGYLPFDVAASVRAPKVKNALAERILTEAEVQRLLALETQPRNRVLLTLLYAAGVRAAELCALTWRDLSAREAGGQITVHGKGEKTRHIVLPPSVWRAVTSLRRPGDGDDDPVFVSRKQGALTPSQVWRIVKAAAARAGLSDAVSSHWLRHAHASHALDRGAPAHLVMATLGHASLTTTSRYSHCRPGESSTRYLAV